MLKYIGKYTTANVMIDVIDPTCAAQIIQLVNHPAFTNPVVVMPDTHAGAGSVIGFTMPITDRVIPNIVGVDINCAMISLRFGSNVAFEDGYIVIDGTHKLTRASIDKTLREAIPFGKEVHEHTDYNMEKSFPWERANELNRQFVMKFNKQTGAKMELTAYTYHWFEAKCKQIRMDVARAVNSIGTLGGGK